MKVVSERLGHANATITLGIYAHVMPGMQAQAAARFDALMGGARHDEQEPRRHPPEVAQAAIDLQLDKDPRPSVGPSLPCQRRAPHPAKPFEPSTFSQPTDGDRGVEVKTVLTNTEFGGSGLSWQGPCSKL